MKSSELEKMRNIGLNIEAGASAYGIGGSAHAGFELDSKEAFSEAITSWKTQSVGAPPDPDNDALKWA